MLHMPQLDTRRRQALISWDKYEHTIQAQCSELGPIKCLIKDKKFTRIEVTPFWSLIQGPFSANMPSFWGIDIGEVLVSSPFWSKIT